MPRRRGPEAGAGAGQLRRLRSAAGTALLLAAAAVQTVLLLGAAAVRWLRGPRLKSLHGQLALVTGAGHGLGRQLALQLADCGCRVLCVDLRADLGEQTARDINSKRPGAALAYCCDVSSPDAVRRLAATVLAEAGAPDLLVNNAGVFPVQPLLTAQPQQVADVVSVNLLAHFWTLLAFLPAMVARNSGHVVAVSSMAGLVGLANKVPYSASKFAVTGLMDALGEEMRLSAHNIKVTCVHPYFIRTRPDLPEDLHLRIPELQPEHAAAEVVRAVQEEAACVTVPRNLLFWLNVLRLLPEDARTLWRDVFYARVLPAAGGGPGGGVQAGGGPPRPPPPPLADPLLKA